MTRVIEASESPARELRLAGSDAPQLLVHLSQRAFATPPERVRECLALQRALWTCALALLSACAPASNGGGGGGSRSFLPLAAALAPLRAGVETFLASSLPLDWRPAAVPAASTTSAGFRYPSFIAHDPRLLDLHARLVSKLADTDIGAPVPVPAPAPAPALASPSPEATSSSSASSTCISLGSTDPSSAGSAGQSATAVPPSAASLSSASSAPAPAPTLAVHSVWLASTVTALIRTLGHASADLRLQVWRDLFYPLIAPSLLPRLEFSLFLSALRTLHPCILSPSFSLARVPSAGAVGHWQFAGGQRRADRPGARVRFPRRGAAAGRRLVARRQEGGVLVAQVCVCACAQTIQLCACGARV